MKLLVVIVNFRVPGLLIDCLRSVEDEIASVPGTRVAVCENGSGDDSAALLREAIAQRGWSNWCTLMVLDSNLGFTGGNNVLIRPALASADPPDYVLLLNPDTVVRPGAFRALVDFMERHPQVGIAGSRLEDPDGTPQRSAFRFQSPLGALESSLRLGLASRLLERWIVAPPVIDQAFQTDWVAGASMIVRRQVFSDVGLLDEGFFTYYDDIDFCFNARKKGWPTWYVPDSRVVHLVGKSSGIDRTPRRMPAYVLEARRRYFLKNHGPLYAAAVDACNLLGLALWRFRVRLTGKVDDGPPNLFRDSLRHSVFVSGFRKLDVQGPKGPRPQPDHKRAH